MADLQAAALPQSIPAGCAIVSLEELFRSAVCTGSRYSSSALSETKTEPGIFSMVLSALATSEKSLIH